MKTGRALQAIACPACSDVPVRLLQLSPEDGKLTGLHTATLNSLTRSGISRGGNNRDETTHGPTCQTASINAVKCTSRLLVCDLCPIA